MSAEFPRGGGGGGGGGGAGPFLARSLLDSCKKRINLIDVRHSPAYLIRVLKKPVY